MNRIIRYIFILLIFFFVVLSSWQMIRGSIIFHTDIARDFLLMEDILISKKPALIGPRSGGIPGVFHGPLWLYINLPAYLIGRGNPVVVGWFWVILFCLSLFTTFWVGKKLFSEEIGLTASFLVAVSASESISSLFNPFGAVILSPLFFLFFLSYIQKQKAIHLLLCMLTLGFIIQFQMAFGMPVLVLSLIPLLFTIFNKKKYKHILTFLILLIPLSTFLLFDLRHQFLQTKSVLNYIQGTENMGKLKLSPLIFVFTRMKEMLLSSVGMFSRGKLLVSIFLLCLILFAFYKILNKKSKTKIVYLYALFFYVGYWILTLVFKGTIWGYYYWPFLPILAIIFAGFIQNHNTKVVFTIFIFIAIFNGFLLLQGILYEKNNYVRTGSWLFYFTQAKKIYEDSQGDFGYYIYTADQYGYSSRYAMNYAQKLFLKNEVFPYEKKQTTYLIIFPSTNPYTSEHWWKKNQVKIDRKADTIFKFNDGSYIEKYILSPEEQKVESDQNLIHNLIFR